MPSSLFESLFEQGLLSEESIQKIRDKQNDKSISLYWDIRLVLYAGVLLLAGGLGVLIYKNINEIGHLAIILMMAAVCLFCYGWSLKKMNPFSWNEVKSPGTIFDYVLLLASLLMITLIGYLQFQYKLFGTEWKLASFIPMVILFFTAYWFDHQGLLSLAIANLAAWLGITVNERSFLILNQINDKTSLITSVLLGAGLILGSILTGISKRKAHFHQLYHQFGTHFYFISCFIALFVFHPAFWPWVPVYLAGSFYHYVKANKERSFYYLVVTVIYTYGLISFIVIDLLQNAFKNNYSTESKLSAFYFTVSAIGMVFFLISLNKKFRKHAGIPKG